MQVAALDPGCVKTFWSRFYSQDWNENRAPTQISGLPMNQTLADFTQQRRLQNGACVFTQPGPKADGGDRQKSARSSHSGVSNWRDPWNGFFLPSKHEEMAF
ncbi:hypothetical protein [Pseudomonas lini]